eukprot:TRINITY_DN2567_c0_g1_i1.p1 TRINITY_DN2567_c0_g1~~TRINITY_DN2567_c0_g1_i1.p1  ORF type:complete len:345 (-),score=20.86 TRINITY_DN2567_c0_g1_i1:105-1139(-)
MLFLIFQGLLLKLVIVSAPGPPPLMYDYDAPDREWYADGYLNCAGLQQSPIKLDPKTKDDPRVKRIKYINYDKEFLFAASYLNRRDDNQIFVRVIGDPDKASAPIITGSVSSDKYELKRFRVVLGRDNKEGSEHKIGHRGYAGEVQFVHENILYLSDEGPGNLNRNRDANGRAVLSFFIKVGNHNRVWQRVIEAMTEVSENGGGNAFVNDLKPEDLIPKDAHNFYFYQGSGPFPPCFENVNWHVFTKPIELSDNQLDDLRTLMRGDGDDLFPNNRPVQDLNFRKVVGHIEKKKTTSEREPSKRRRSKLRRRPYRPARGRRPPPRRRRPPPPYFHDGPSFGFHPH